jgi:hypothetical protein
MLLELKSVLEEGGGDGELLERVNDAIKTK